MKISKSIQFLLAKMQNETKLISTHEVRNKSKLKSTLSLNIKQLGSGDKATSISVSLQPEPISKIFNAKSETKIQFEFESSIIRVRQMAFMI